MRKHRLLSIRALAILPLALVAFVHCAFVQELAGGGEGDAVRDAGVLPDEMGGIYKKRCKICHGADLGGALLGPSLLVSPLVHGDSLEALETSIAEGYPDRRMPAWAGRLSDAEIRGLAIFLLEKRTGDRGDP